MKIYNKQALVYDMKVFKNVFSCTFLDTESDNVEVYEVSERKNQINDIVGIFLSPDYIFFGYNTIHYSIPIMNFIIENKRTMPDNYEHICNTIYSLSKEIISTVNTGDITSWKKYKHTKHFLTVDLYTMLAPKKDRFGLKEALITSFYKDIRECPFSYNSELKNEDIDSMLEYSLNDAFGIRHIAESVKDKLLLRERASVEYDINLMSKDDVSMGLEILKNLYLDKTNQEWGDIKDKKSPITHIALRDCILPFLEFKSSQINDLVKELKETVVNIEDKKPYEKHFLLNDGFQNDIEISFGVGGLHSIVDSNIVIPQDDEELVIADCVSMYPSFILSYGIVPKHISKTAFLDIFKDIWNKRIEAKKKGDKTKDKILKNILVSVIGNYRNYQSWLYGPFSAMQVNIACQLFILKLTEMLISAGIKIIQINTDGIIFLAKKNIDYSRILSEWEGLTCLTLDVQKLKSIYQYDINNYLAVNCDGTTKTIGLFSSDVLIGKGMKPAIISKAINNWFVNGVEPEKTIKSSRDIRDFITYQKVDSRYNVEYNNKDIQRINRFYVSTSGYQLYKYTSKGNSELPVIVHFKDGTYKRVEKKDIYPGGEYYQNPKVSHFEYNSGTNKFDSKDRKYEAILKGCGITIVNNLEYTKVFPTNINYIYYIGEAKKIISQLENRQLSLF